VSICVISQPRLFPGLHYLHRMMIADVFVVLDSVQYNPRHEENRTKLKSPRGPQWLTVPMRRFSREQRICDTRIDNSRPWQRKSVKTLSNLYGRAPYYTNYAPEIAKIMGFPHVALTQLDQASWEPALRLLGITCEFVLASELPVSGKGSQLLVEICRHVGTDTYLSGSFGRDYLEISQFAVEGITILFHEYSYPIYPQRFGDFVPFLSYLDMLFNVDLERDRVLAGGKVLPK
jgi:hypothetical protein